MSLRIPEILEAFEKDTKYTFKMIVDDKDIAGSDEIANVVASPMYTRFEYVDEFNGLPVVTIYGQLDTWSVEFPVSTYAVVDGGVVLLYGPKGTAEFTPVG